MSLAPCDHDDCPLSGCLLEYAQHFKEMFNADAASVQKIGRSLFLIIGTRRKSADWYNEKGEPQHFDYLDGKCVASGATIGELEASAREYCRISKLTMEEYFQELVQQKVSFGAPGAKPRRPRE